MKCLNCGKEFKTFRFWQKFCSEKCGKSYRREKFVKPENEPKPAPKPKPKQYKTLSDWAREADECNLDYGTYRGLITAGKTFEELKAVSDNRAIATHARKGRNVLKEM